jgi:hypothetical protein
MEQPRTMSGYRNKRKAAKSVDKKNKKQTKDSKYKLKRYLALIYHTSLQNSKG